ncbi:MAG: hypothetical protein M3317_07820, partial [Actinomycetota bacterium]|nr:hypothetical protein [Actinomycetota bacterium]
QGPQRWRLRLQWAGALVPILASCALLGVAVAQAKPPEKPEYLASMKAVHTAQQAQHKSSTTSVDSRPKNEPSSQQDHVKNTAGSAAAQDVKKTYMQAMGSRANRKTQDKNPKASETQGAKAPNTSREARSGASAYTGSVSAIGDSVMLGAVSGLQKDIRGLTVVDAEVGLQVYDAIDILKSRRASGQLGDVVIVHLGNNGTFTKGEFDQIMHILSGVDRVVFVNLKVPRPWEEPNNEVIAEGVKRYPKAVLVDWHSASVNHPEYFYGDGYHLRPEAQKIYADLVSSYLTDK